MQAINDRNINSAFNYRHQSTNRQRSSRQPVRQAPDEVNQQRHIPSTYNLTAEHSPPVQGVPKQYHTRGASSTKHFNNKRILVQAIAKSFGILHAYGEYSNFMKVSKRFLAEKGLLT